MLWVPEKGQLRVESNLGSVGDATPGATVTTGATASVKGTAVQLIATTAFDAYWITILASGYSLAATASEGALDILTGAATEEVLIPNLLMGQAPVWTVAANGPKRWDFPLYIPAGSRLAAQAAGNRVSTAMQVAVILYGGHGVPPFRVGSKVTTYGIGTVPAGTAITPGASAAEGSWTQIVAATTEDHFAFVPSFQVAAADVSHLIRTLYVEMGIGAATEEAIGGDYIFSTNADECTMGPFNSMPAFQDVPSGTRLVMRASCSGTLDAYNGAVHAVS